jgi:nucleoside-diphosphate-sugar epimerase
LKIVVTGAMGFIGSHLLRELDSHENKIVALTDPYLSSVIDGVENFSVDVTSGRGLGAGLSGADGVVHLAARNHVIKETEKDPLSAYRYVNVEGTRNVIRAAVEAGAQWFVHFSSVKAMGEGGDAVFNEDSLCHPSTPYGISKLESEEAVREEAVRSGMRAVILRLPMVYGPGNKGNLPRMIHWADRGYPFPLFQPDNLRSMIYVENVVAGVLALIKKAPEGISTYILKDREDYSTRTVYSAICRELGKSPRFISFPEPLVRLGGIVSEDFRKITGSFRVSSGKIVKDLGFTPPFSLEEGIARTVQWYKRSVRSRSA